MFLSLARLYSGGPLGLHTVQTLPAVQLGRWLDEVWYSDGGLYQGFPTDTQFGSDLEAIRRALGHPQPSPGVQHGVSPSGLAPPEVGPPAPFVLSGPPRGLASCGAGIWHHLIYAYLVESTGVFDVMAEIGRRLVAGESLGTLSRPSLVWLRNTEELFFRQPASFGITGTVSELRPSAGVTRRNTYWRMFGMDVPHPLPGSSEPVAPWKAMAEPANLDFADKLVELLRQVWVGIVNNQNQSGSNPTDESYVALLCTALRDMLHNRRQHGMLAREEFVHVSTMSWFHLTLMDSGVPGGDRNASIIRDLQAQGTAPEQRLANLAQRVGLRVAARSRELFQLCQLMSLLLRSIELGAYDTPDRARLLFDGNDPAIESDMRTIVNLWQSATGQPIKDHVAVTGATAQPIRVPAPLTASTPSGQGGDLLNGARGSRNGVGAGI